jgi:hypothetical protein
VDELTVSSKVVCGTPVSRFRQFRDSPGQFLWAYASPPALVLATIKLVFFYSRLSFGATVLYVLMIPVAFVGLFVLGTMRRMPPIECECPACGARVWFNFMRHSESEPSNARCVKCLAYAIQRDDQISEVPLEMTSESGFDVHNAQYGDNVCRGDDERITFAMPAFCAMCGAEATHTREITIRFADKGINKGLWQQANYARTGTPGRIGSSSSSTSDRISGRDFREMQVPVCAQHERTTRPDPMVVDDWGDLTFASYRFYKSFIVANHIVLSGIDEFDGPSDKHMPTARVA